MAPHSAEWFDAGDKYKRSECLGVALRHPAHGSCAVRLLMSLKRHAVLEGSPPRMTVVWISPNGRIGPWLGTRGTRLANCMTRGKDGRPRFVAAAGSHS